MTVPPLFPMPSIVAAPVMASLDGWMLVSQMNEYTLDDAVVAVVQPGCRAVTAKQIRALFSQ